MSLRLLFLTPRQGKVHRYLRLYFLDHLYFLRDLGGGSQLTVDNFGLNLFDHLDRGRGWRRRRRWWWRSHQECHQLLFRQGFRVQKRDENQNAEQNHLQDKRKQRGCSALSLKLAT